MKKETYAPTYLKTPLQSGIKRTIQPCSTVYEQKVIGDKGRPAGKVGNGKKCYSGQRKNTEFTETVKRKHSIILIMRSDIVLVV